MPVPIIDPTAEGLVQGPPPFGSQKEAIEFSDMMSRVEANTGMQTAIPLENKSREYPRLPGQDPLVTYQRPTSGIPPLELSPLPPLPSISEDFLDTAYATAARGQGAPQFSFSPPRDAGAAYESKYGTGGNLKYLGIATEELINSFIGAGAGLASYLGVEERDNGLAKLRDGWQKDINDAYGTLDYDTQRRINAKVLTGEIFDDTAGTIFTKLVGITPSMVALAGTSVVGGMLGRLAVSSAMGYGAEAVSLADVIAKVAAGQSALATGSAVGGAIGGGVGSFAQSYGATTNQSVNDIDSISTKALYKIPAFFKARQGYIDQGKTASEADTLARSDLKDMAMQDTGTLLSAILVGLTEMPMGAFIGRLRGLKAGVGDLANAKGFLGRVKEGVWKEGLQETVQNPAEQLAQNLAAQQLYDPKRATFEGVAESAVQGGLLGAISGGVIGGALGRGPDTRTAQAPAGPSDVPPDIAAAATRQPPPPVSGRPAGGGVPFGIPATEPPALPVNEPVGGMVNPADTQMQMDLTVPPYLNEYQMPVRNRYAPPPELLARGPVAPEVTPEVSPRQRNLDLSNAPRQLPLDLQGGEVAQIVTKPETVEGGTVYYDEQGVLRTVEGKPTKVQGVLQKIKKAKGVPIERVGELTAEEVIARKAKTFKKVIATGPEPQQLEFDFNQVRQIVQEVGGVEPSEAAPVTAETVPITKEHRNSVVDLVGKSLRSNILDKGNLVRLKYAIANILKQSDEIIHEGPRNALMKASSIFERAKGIYASKDANNSIARSLLQTFAAAENINPEAFKEILNKVVSKISAAIRGKEGTINLNEDIYELMRTAHETALKAENKTYKGSDEYRLWMEAQGHKWLVGKVNEINERFREANKGENVLNVFSAKKGRVSNEALAKKIQLVELAMQVAENQAYKEASQYFDKEGKLLGAEAFGPVAEALQEAYVKAGLKPPTAEQTNMYARVAREQAREVVGRYSYFAKEERSKIRDRMTDLRQQKAKPKEEIAQDKAKAAAKKTRKEFYKGRRTAIPTAATAVEVAGEAKRVSKQKVSKATRQKAAKATEKAFKRVEPIEAPKAQELKQKAAAKKAAPVVQPEVKEDGKAPLTSEPVAADQDVQTLRKYLAYSQKNTKNAGLKQLYQKFLDTLTPANYESINAIANKVKVAGPKELRGILTGHGINEQGANIARPGVSPKTLNYSRLRTKFMLVERPIVDAIRTGRIKNAAELVSNLIINIDQVSRFIKNDPDLNVLRDTARYIQQVYKLLPDKGEDINVLYDETHNAPGSYFSLSNRMLFNPMHEQQNLGGVYTFIHELFHPITIFALNNDSQLVTELEQLYNEVFPNIQDFYAKKSLEEFVPEIYADPNLRARLAGIDLVVTPDGLRRMNFFERFVNSIVKAINRLFGARMPKFVLNKNVNYIENALVRAMSLSEEFIESEGVASYASTQFLPQSLRPKPRDRAVNISRTAEAVTADTLMDAARNLSADIYAQKKWGGRFARGVSRVALGTLGTHMIADLPLAKDWGPLNIRDNPLMGLKALEDLLVAAIHKHMNEGELVAAKLAALRTDKPEVYALWNTLTDQARDFEIHPDQEFTPGQIGTMNGHLIDDAFIRAKYEELHDIYANKLGPEGKAAYDEGLAYNTRVWEEVANSIRVNTFMAFNATEEQAKQYAKDFGKPDQQDVNKYLAAGKTAQEANVLASEDAMDNLIARIKKENENAAEKLGLNKDEEAELTEFLKATRKINAPYWAKKRTGSHLIVQRYLIDELKADTKDAIKEAITLHRYRNPSHRIGHTRISADGYSARVFGYEVHYFDHYDEAVEFRQRAEQELVKEFGDKTRSTTKRVPNPRVAGETEDALDPEADTDTKWLLSDVLRKDKELEQYLPVSNKLVQAVRKNLMSSGMAEKDVNHALSAFMLSTLDMRPDTSALHAYRRYKKVPGAMEDMGRAFAMNSRSTAYYLGHLQYDRLITNKLIKMREKLDSMAYMKKEPGSKYARMQDTYVEINKRNARSAIYAQQNKLADFQNEYMFLNFIAGASFNILNPTQIITHTTPQIYALLAESGHGYLKAAQIVKDAVSLVAPHVGRKLLRSKFGFGAWNVRQSGDVFNVTNDVIDNIRKSARTDKEDIVKLLIAMGDMGKLQFTFANSLNEMADGKVGSTWNRIMDVARATPHMGEVFNRASTAIAAWDTLKITNPNMSLEDKYIRIAQVIDNTQGNYSEEMKGRYMRRGAHDNQILDALNQSVWMYKQFSLMTMYQISKAAYIWAKNSIIAEQLAKHGLLKSNPVIDRHARIEARRLVTSMLATQFALAGAIGVTPEPIAIALALSFWAMSDPDDPKDWQLEVRKFFNELTGSTKAGELITRGPISHGIFGVDVTNRIGLQNMFFGTNMDTGLYGKDYAQALMFNLGGPSVAQVGRWADAAHYMQVGDYQRAAQYAFPRAIGDLVATYGLATKGMVDTHGNEIMGSDKMGPEDLAKRFLGFIPAEYNERQSMRAATYFMKNKIGARRSALLDNYFRTNGANQAEIDAFNKRHPYIAITEDTKRDSATRRANIKGGVNLSDRERAAYAKELGAFNVE